MSTLLIPHLCGGKFPVDNFEILPLTSYITQSQLLPTHKMITFENIEGKRENAGNLHFSPFLQFFLPLHKLMSMFELNLLPAKTLKLDVVKIFGW